MRAVKQALVDELKVKGLRQGIIAKHGRFLSAAGRQSPVAEFGDSYLVMHPPQKPFFEEGPTEEIEIHTDERGILLDEQGKVKKIAGAKFKGQEVLLAGRAKARHAQVFNWLSRFARRGAQVVLQRRAGNNRCCLSLTQPDNRWRAFHLRRIAGLG